MWNFVTHGFCLTYKDVFAWTEVFAWVWFDEQSGLMDCIG
jgi:hypothetical protein